jgi:hypothetical protein
MILNPFKKDDISYLVIVVMFFVTFVMVFGDGWTEVGYVIYEKGIKPSLSHYTTQFVPFDNIKAIYHQKFTKPAYLIHFNSPRIATLKSELGGFHFPIVIDNQDRETVFKIFEQCFGARWVTVYNKELIAVFDYKTRKLKLVKMDNNLKKEA